MKQLWKVVREGSTGWALLEGPPEGLQRMTAALEDDWRPAKRHEVLWYHLNRARFSWLEMGFVLVVGALVRAIWF